MLRNRQQSEQNEKQRLAPYAVAAGDSNDRQYEEPEHPWRTCFQRDRDRIVHSAAFRRLEAKTQVFVTPVGAFDAGADYCRTRLTHTIEVAQVARTLARILGANEDLTEAAALAHDLGHGPYGHCGEAVLNDLMAEHGGFEHNAQSLRVVEWLEHPYPDFYGLNLTRAVRHCLAKHESRYDCCLTADDYGPGLGSIEGQIADLADAVAYNSHDLDDAMMMGLIGEDDLADITLYRAIETQVREKFPKAHRYARQLRCAKSLIDLLLTDALEQTQKQLDRFDPRRADEVCTAAEKIVVLSPERQDALGQLEDFLMERVYLHKRTEGARRQADRELRTLFEAYVRDPNGLPERYRRRIDGQEVHRVVCDYLAGMTDRFCHECYRRMTGEING